MHFKLNWSCSGGFVFSTCVSRLGIDCTAISKERFVIKIVFFTVGIASLETTCVVKETLVICELLVCRLSLSQGNFFADISFFLLDLFFPLSSDLLHSFLSFNLSHTMISELLSFLHFLILILIPFLFLYLFILFSSLKSSSPQIFFFLQILFIINTSLNFCSFLQLKLRLSLGYIERIDDVCKRLVNRVMLKGSTVGCQTHMNRNCVTSRVFPV